MMRKPLPYGPDDDTAAEIYVREALRRSQRGNWPALLADDAEAESETHLGTNDPEQVPVREQRGRASLPANKDRVRVLLTVLCEHAGRPNDVGHFLMAWERLRAERNRPVRPSIPSPMIYRPERAEETGRTSVRTTSSANATLLAALLLAVVALIVVVVVLG